MVLEILRYLGLTKNDIRVYMSLLKEGRSSGTEIRKSTKITNSRVYASLDMLIGNGLVIYRKTSKGKVYSALDPNILDEIARTKQKKISRLVQSLKKLQKIEKLHTDTAVFEGFNGFKTALYNLANDCPKNETLYIIGFSNQDYKNEKLAALLRDVNKISVRKKHRFKMILDNRDNTFYSQRKKEKISEIRFMENSFTSPASIDIFQDKVYILLWDENPYVFTIQNKKIAEGFKIYFNFLWNIARN